MAEGVRYRPPAQLAGVPPAGTVWITIGNSVFNNASYGGFKPSELDRECGPEGLDASAENKNIITWIAPQPFRWY